jgi:hypothetical protein
MLVAWSPSQLLKVFLATSLARATKEAMRTMVVAPVGNLPSEARMISGPDFCRFMWVWRSRAHGFP